MFSGPANENKNEMKHEIEDKKWGEGKRFEWKTSLALKPSIASYFFVRFVWVLLIPTLLRYWLLGKHGLNPKNLDAKIPEDLKLYINLWAEIVAFGIKVYKLGEIRASGYGLSFASLVEEIITVEEYELSKKKYIKLRAIEIYDFFSNSIENILRSSFSSLNLESIEYRCNLLALAHLFYYPLFLEEATFGIFNWAAWLSAEEAEKIRDKIDALEAKRKEVNFDVDKPNIAVVNFFEEYGFGPDYCDKIWKKISDDIKHVEEKK